MKDTSTSNAIIADNSTETPLETPKISPVSEYIAGTQEDVKPQEELSSGSSIGVFKPVSDDFQKSLGNQTVVSRMCCQTFAFVQSMCIMD